MASPAWLAAEALHHEAHGEREPFVYCTQQTCVDLKDALHDSWRAHRPI